MVVIFRLQLGSSYGGTSASSEGGRNIRNTRLELSAELLHEGLKTFQNGNLFRRLFLSNGKFKQVPSAMHVKLMVYNLTGQEVAALVDEMNARGKYAVTFDASQLQSGLYFSVLQAGEVRQVRRLLFLK